MSFRPFIQKMIRQEKDQASSWKNSIYFAHDAITFRSRILLSRKTGRLLNGGRTFLSETRMHFRLMPSSMSASAATSNAITKRFCLISQKLLKLATSQFNTQHSPQQFLHFHWKWRHQLLLVNIFETVIQGLHFFCYKLLDIYAPLPRTWDSSGPTVVYALRKMADFDFLGNY